MKKTESEWYELFKDELSKIKELQPSHFLDVTTLVSVDIPLITEIPVDAFKYCEGRMELIPIFFEDANLSTAFSLCSSTLPKPPQP